VDRGQMHQVFSNLFINAVQALPRGGSIKVRAENRLITADSGLALPPGKYVVVTGADQGKGVSPEILKKIFDPYFTTKQKGSGLGLATVYAIVTQHGGAITVDSRVGRGTTFHLWLPAAEGVFQPGEPAETQTLRGHGRILLMDGDILVLEVVGKMLRKLGYEPVFAQEGEEALAIYAQGQNTEDPFAVVILDLTIPGGMGGMEAIQHLLAQAPQARALVSSGYADHPIMASYQDYGFQGVIAKPYKISGLSEVLQKVIVAFRGGAFKRVRAIMSLSAGSIREELSEDLRQPQDPFPLGFSGRYQMRQPRPYWDSSHYPQKKFHMFNVVFNILNNFSPGTY
jgi:two-component system cell cycle sensor histidine kinase/response regulator CckA